MIPPTKLEIGTIVKLDTDEQNYLEDAVEYSVLDFDSYYKVISVSKFNETITYYNLLNTNTGEIVYYQALIPFDFLRGELKV